MKIPSFKKNTRSSRLLLLMLLFLAVSITVTSMFSPITDSSPAPVVTIGQTVDYANPKPGDIVNFTVSYSNPSGWTAYNVTLFEWMPSSLIFVSSKPFYDGVSDPNAGFLRWSRGDVAPGGSGKVIVNVKVGNVPVGTNVTNTVHLTYDSGSGSTTEVLSSASLTVAQGAGVSVYPDQVRGVPPSTGATASYNVTVTNTGNGLDSFNISLSSVAYNPSSGAKNWTITLYNSTGYLLATVSAQPNQNKSSAWTNWGTLAVVTLAPTQSAVYQISVVEPAGTSGAGDACIKVGLTATSQFDPSVSDGATTDTVVKKAVGITVLPDNAAEANPGETVTYLHEIDNGGGWKGNQNGAEVIDVFYNSSQGWTYSFYFMNGTALTDTNNNGLLDVGLIAQYGSIGIQVKVTVPYGNAAGLVDNAMITAVGASSGRVGTANDTTTVTRSPLVGVVKELFSNNPAYVGDTATYRITVTNLGNTKLTFVPLDDTFPPSLQFISSNPAPDSYSEISGTLHWNNLSILETLQSAVVTINFSAVAGSTSVREGAYVIDAMDQFGDFVSATSVNTQLRIMQPFTITVTASPLGALGGTFNVTYTQRNVTYTNVQETTSWVQTVDENTLVAVSYPQEYLPSEAGSLSVRYRFDHYDPAASVNMTANETITLAYTSQYKVTFNQSGLDGTATVTVLTVNSTSKVFGDLPFSEWINSSDTLTYNYETIVDSSTANMRFALKDVTGPASPITVSSAMTITGNYAVQWNVTFAETGLDGTAIGTVVTINGTAKTFGQLPSSAWIYAGSTVTYSYANPVASSVAGKQFRLNSVTDPTSGFTVTSAVTVTADYVFQWNVTFSQAGVGGDYSGTVVTVDGTGHGVSGLPSSFWWDDQSTHSFAYASPLTLGSTKQYVWTSTSGLSTLQIDAAFKVSGAGVITGAYKTQYYVTFSQTGVDTDYSGTVVTINGTISADRNGISFWAYDGSTESFAYGSPLTVNTGKQYSLVSVNTTSPISITDETTVTGNYKTQYNVTFGQTGVDTDFTGTMLTVNGTGLDRNGASFWADAGDHYIFAYASSLTVSANAKQYVLTGLNASSPLTVSGVELVVSTYKTQYYLTVETNPLGLDSPSGGGWYDSGVIANVSTAQYADIVLGGSRYRFDSWIGAGGTYASASVLMDSAKTATANYVTQYYLTLTTSPPGVDNVAGEGWYDACSNASISAGQNVVSDSSRYGFNGWTTTDMSEITNSSATSTTVLVDKAKTVTANYLLQCYVTFSQTGVGSDFAGIVVTVNGTGYDRNGVSFWADVGDVYYFTYSSPLAVTANGKQYVLTETNTSSPLTVLGTVNIVGSYKTQYYIAITSTHDSPTASAWVDEGADFTASVTSPTEIAAGDHQWVCTGYSVDGGSTVAGTSHTFDDVQSAHAIIFSWKQQFWIQVNSAHDSPTASAWVDQGSDFTASVTSPADDDGAGTRYTCTGYTLDGNSPVTDTSTSYNFTKVLSAHTVTFNWVAQFQVTFEQSGQDGTATGTVVTVNGTNKAFSDLPLNMWVDSGDSVTYSYASPISSSATDKQFRLNTVTGSPSPVTVSGPTAVIGNYKTQYNVTFGQTGVDTDFTGTVLAVNGTSYNRNGASFWADAGNAYDFTYSSPLTVAANAKRYVLTSVNATTPLTVSQADTISGNYKTQYQVSFASNPPEGGTTTPFGINIWEDPGSLSISATANFGNSFSSWSSSTASITFANSTSASTTATINGPGTITANFQLTTVEITVTSSPTGSGFVKADGTAYTTPQTFTWAIGDTHTLEAQPSVSDGASIQYVWTGWSDSGARTHTYTVPSTSTTVTANYKTQYYLTVVTNPLGVATPSGEGWYDADSSATISTSQYTSIIPSSSRYRFDGWTTADMSEITDPSMISTSVLMDKAKTVTAGYVIQYYLTVTSAYDTPVGMGWYDAGATANASLTSGVVSGGEGTQYVFTSWSGDASGTGLTSNAIIMNGPKTATANWKTQYFLTVNSAHGTSGGQGWYDLGSTAYATVNPLTVSGAAGVRYVFTGWSGDASGAGSPSNAITMNAPKTATADWKTQYCLTVNSAYGTPSGMGWYDSGATAYATLNTGLVDDGNGARHVFTNWNGDASGTNYAQSNPITMNGPKNAAADWKTRYGVTFSQSGLDNSASGTIVTVNGAAESYSDLPYYLWVDSGASVNYAYGDVSSSAVGKKFVLTGVSGPGSPMTVTGPLTVTGNYETQYSVTFDQTGVGSDFTGTIVTIDGTAYSGNALPAVFWWNSNSAHTFSYASPLIVNISRQYSWASTTGLSTLQSGTLVTSGSGSVAGNYGGESKCQVTFSQTGVNSDFTGTVIVIDGSNYRTIDLPVSFWWDVYSTHSFAYQSPLAVSPNLTQYVWSNTSGPWPWQSATINITASATVVGNYKTQYYLTMETTPAGVTSPSGAGWYDAGALATISTQTYIDVLPGSSRYIFKGWATPDMTEITSRLSSPTTVLMDKGKTVTALYAVQCAVTFSQTGVNSDFTGTILTVDGGNYNFSDLPALFWWDSGSSHTFAYQSPLVVTSNAKQYVWAGATGLSTLQSDSITVSGSGSVTGDYKTQYFLTVSSPYGTAGGQGWYDSGATAYATLDVGLVDDGNGARHVFTNWSGDASGTNYAQSNPITMNGPKNAAADWKTQYYLAVNSVYGTPSGMGWYDSGKVAYASVTPLIVAESSGVQYVFTQWSGDASGAGSTSNGIVMNGPRTATANWNTQYYLTVTSTYGTTGGAGWYDNGTSAYASVSTGFVSGEAGARHAFAGWSGDASGSDLTSNAITMNAPKTAKADWKVQYYLTMVTNFGTVTPGSGWYDAGTIVPIEATAPSNATGERYAWNSWTGTGDVSYSGVDNPASITMNSAVSETASWTRQFYLTVTSLHGTTSGEGWYDSGTTAFAGVTPLTVSGPSGVQYVFTRWSGDASGGSSPSNQIIMDAPKTAVANWKAQCLVTFGQTGLDGTATGSVVTVDEEAKAYGDLPFSEWVDVGSAVGYSYQSIVSSSISGMQFRLDSVSGPASRLSVTEPVNVTGNYRTQYYLWMDTNFGSVAPGSGWYDSGSTVNISAAPPNNVLGDGYSWYGWNGTGTVSYSGPENPASVTLDSPVNESARWKIVPSITISVSSETVESCDRVVVYGTTLPINSTTFVHVTYTFPNGTYVTHTVETDEHGNFNDTLPLGGESLYALFNQEGTWNISANRAGDFNKEDASSSTTLGIQPQGLFQVNPLILVLLIGVAVALTYLTLARRINGRKPTTRSWRFAAIILAVTGLVFGVASLGINWMSVAGTATTGGQTYTVSIALYPYGLGAVSISNLQYIGDRIPSMIDSAWQAIPKSAGPVMSLYLAPAGCALAVASLYKPKTQRRKIAKVAILAIAGLLILVPVVQSFIFVAAQAGTTAGASTGYGIGQYFALMAGLLIGLASLFAVRETPAASRTLVTEGKSGGKPKPSASGTS